MDHQTCQPALIAIGSPLSLPPGLVNLEPSSGTDAATPEKRGRQLERELASMSIACFFTGRGTITRHLVYRGVEVKRQLDDLGYQVIEVYPHASMVVLFGDQVPPRRSPRSLAFLKEWLPSLICGLEPHRDSLDKNTGDALLNSYTALLHLREETDLLGDPGEGLLVIPRLPR